jgi:hypothetical protein
LKYGPDNDSNGVVKDNTLRTWNIGKLRGEWQKHPERRPGAIIGVTGPPRNRMIVSAIKIAPGWLSSKLEEDRSFQEVLPEDSTNSPASVDYLELRYRRLIDDQLRFQHIPPRLVRWIDEHGIVQNKD